MNALRSGTFAVLWGVLFVITWPAIIAHAQSRDTANTTVRQVRCASPTSSSEVNSIVSDTTGDITKDRLKCVKQALSALVLVPPGTSAVLDTPTVNTICGTRDSTRSIPASLRRDRLPECHYTVALLAHLTEAIMHPRSDSPTDLLLVVKELRAMTTAARQAQKAQQQQFEVLIKHSALVRQEPQAAAKVKLMEPPPIRVVVKSDSTRNCDRWCNVRRTVPLVGWTALTAAAIKHLF